MISDHLGLKIGWERGSIRVRTDLLYNPMLGRIAGRDTIIRTESRNSWFTDDELALRLSRNIQGYEAALYGYRGYWKSPAGLEPATGKATFPRLAVYGGSLRGAAGPGIANLEFGYYSPSDKDFYFRPTIHYKIDDHWSTEIGGNIFGGERNWTFFGQFRKDTNIYAGTRYSF